MDVESIADDYGISIQRADLRPVHDGEICHNNGVFTIRVNNTQDENRQRFTIAHEIAHYMLHMGYIVKNKCVDRGNSGGFNNYKEIEANRLAADILMPLDLIRRHIKEGVKTIAGLSKQLRVSEESLNIRLDI